MRWHVGENIVFFRFNFRKRTPSLPTLRGKKSKEERAEKNKQACKAYREKKKAEDPNYAKSEMLRSQFYRLSMTEEQRTRNNEKGLIR